jgi:hypothetical protein
MTEPDENDDEPQTPPAEPVEVPVDQVPNDGQSAGSEPAGPDSDTFPRAYVEELRTENKDLRTKAKDVDKYREAAMLAARRLATAGILHSPDDLPISDEFWAEDGLPDYEKIRKAAEELASERPYLARARGSVGQGARPEPSPEFSLAAALRKAAGY